MDISTYSWRLSEVIRILKRAGCRDFPTICTGGKSYSTDGDLDAEEIVNLALDETHDGDVAAILGKRRGQNVVTPMRAQEYVDRLARVVTGLAAQSYVVLPKQVLTSGPVTSQGGQLEALSIGLALDSTFDGNAKHVVEAAKLLVPSAQC